MWSWVKERLVTAGSFFPVKLLLLHFRRSHLLLLFWLLCFGFVAGLFGERYGFKYLFLSPEYLGETGFWSFTWLGFALGLFIMAYHINSYIYYGYRFSFLATLQRPLWKFCINNSLIPLAFFFFLCFQLVRFSSLDQNGTGAALERILGLSLGTSTAVAFIMTYFLSTIKSLEPVVVGKQGAARLDQWMRMGSREADPTHASGVAYYLKNFWTLKRTRSVAHYDQQLLNDTIGRHHLSAASFFLLLLVLITLLSFFAENAYFRLPAGGTVFLILSIYLMLIGAVYARLKSWTVTGGLVLLLLINYFSGWELFYRANQAFGLNYSQPPVPYKAGTVAQLNNDSIEAQDHRAELKRLKAWKAQFSGVQKPPLVLLNVSGGGLRSTLFTIEVLKRLDSLSQGRFFPHVHMIAGSSGGMIGAAYYRSLYYNGGPTSTQPDQLADDLLNPVVFALATHDLLFRFKKIELAGRKYLWDRGYAFDRRLAQNSGGLLDHPLAYYKKHEDSGRWPNLILSPTLVADGRKLLIANQGWSFLTYSRYQQAGKEERRYDAVEFGRLFAQQDPGALYFPTALRMSASFPYITPLVSLPTEPPLQVIDAGVRDNEGLELSLRYLKEFETWLKEEVGPIMIVEIKANRPDQVSIEVPQPSRLNDLLLPVEGVVRSFGNFQSFNKALLLNWSEDLLSMPVEYFRFSLLDEKEAVSLSWHLTENEKQQVRLSIERPQHRRLVKEILSRLPKK